MINTVDIIISSRVVFSSGLVIVPLKHFMSSLCVLAPDNLKPFETDDRELSALVRGTCSLRLRLRLAVFRIAKTIRMLNANIAQDGMTSVIKVSMLIMIL